MTQTTNRLFDDFAKLMTDAAGAEVADGEYTIVVESSDNWQASYLTTIPLVKGAAPASIELPESESFGPITVTYTPAPE